MSRNRGRRGGRNRGGKGRENGSGANVALLPAVRQNAMLQGNGANTRQDRSAGQTYAASSVNPYFLNNYVRRNQEYLRMYNTSWEAQKTITIPVDDALKYRAELKGLDEGDARRIWDAYDEKQLDQQNRRAFIQERLFGGCGQYGVFKRDKMEGVDQPLRPEAIRPGDFEAINVVDVTRLSVAEWVTDPFSPDYDRSLNYRIAGLPVDKSRLIVFDGQSVIGKASRNILEAGRYNPLGFGESKLSTLYDILRFCTGTQEGAYHLVNLASVLIIKAENLRTMKATNSRAYQALEEVIEQVNIFRGAVLEGKGVEVSQHSATFGSVPELLMMYLQIYSAASDVPATRFLGQAPGGLNATGESDTQNYHDAIRSFQQQRVKPVQKRQIDWIGCDIWGWAAWRRRRANLEIVYPPLWSETAKEKADRMAIYSGLVCNLYASGMISGEAAVRELKARDAFATDIEAEDFLNKGPRMEDSPLDPDSALAELEDAEAGKGGSRGAGKMTKNPAASFKRSISFNAGDWDENKHPRDGDGKFGEGHGSDGGKEKAGDAAAREGTTTSAEEKQKKIDSVKIDFDRDNILPGLNTEDLKELGKENKPVLLKKVIIEKNESHHPDIGRKETAEMIGQALYDSDLITPGHKDYPYFNFISRVGEDKSTVVLVELAETKNSYEIVNWHWVNEAGRGRIERKGKMFGGEE